MIHLFIRESTRNPHMAVDLRALISVHGRKGTVVIGSLSGEASVTIPVFPTIEAPDFTFKVKCGAYAGAQVCLTVLGAAKFDTIIN